MDFNALTRKKHVDIAAPSGLKRCLGATDLVLLGIGCIIGTGIFVLTGHVAATHAGPAVVLSYVIAGLACTAAALAYAELSASLGGCGSAYGYSYMAFGELFAWLIGWTLILEYGMAVATVANGWSGYFGSALRSVGIELPRHLTATPADGGTVNLPAMLVVLALMGLIIYGVRESARFNAAIVFVKLLTIAVFIGVAAFHVDPANWKPFVPFGWFETLPNHESRGVLTGASIVFFAYIGFDAVSTAAEEARNPQRDLPIGIIGSLAVCTLLYLVVAGLLTGVARYDTLDVSYPVAFALEKLGVTWASGLVAAGAIAGMTTVMLVLYYGLTRIIFALARDGLIPAGLAAVNPRTQTPVVVIVLCGVVIALLAGLVPLGKLAELVNFGTLAAFVMVCAGMMVLRRDHPDLPRPFKTPLYPSVPVFGVLSCAMLMYFLSVATWMYFAIWAALGAAIYFGYSVRHSALAAPRA
ncbi:MAG: amino acid permease [Gammaproteobacteria bacterium]